MFIIRIPPSDGHPTYRATEGTQTPLLFEMMWPVSNVPTPSASAQPSQPPKRCAVYARVSVADVQPVEFNSLAAQIEACEQYVTDRAAMGWVLAGPAYTDDGESAKDLQRPGLSALMKSVQQGAVEVVVVYRLDRLSRSLLDLTEVLLPLLKFKCVDLVSVTQHLDTHSPSGRLSLNLLTSFAEFERETIGERTRDKLSATRRQGRWQGGGTPLGYDVDFEQRVVMNKSDASLVREIFKRYAASETMAELMGWLERQRVKTKKWTTRDGKQRGGKPIDRTTLYRMLSNRMYIGEALFDGEWHSRIYPPIIDLEVWHAVQDKLVQRARRKGVPNEGRSEYDFPLGGRLFWHDGRPYTLFKSSLRDNGRYRYYLAPATEAEKANGQPPFTWSAEELHQIIVDHLRQHFKDPTAWLPMVQGHQPDDSDLHEDKIREALRLLDQAWDLFTDRMVAAMFCQLITRVTLQPDGMHIEMNVPALIHQIRLLAEISVATEDVPEEATHPGTKPI